MMALISEEILVVWGPCCKWKITKSHNFRSTKFKMTLLAVPKALQRSIIEHGVYLQHPLDENFYLFENFIGLHGGVFQSIECTSCFKLSSKRQFKHVHVGHAVNQYEHAINVGIRGTAKSLTQARRLVRSFPLSCDVIDTSRRGRCFVNYSNALSQRDLTLAHSTAHIEHVFWSPPDGLSATRRGTGQSLKRWRPTLLRCCASWRAYLGKFELVI
jgi:hypothetical protein